MSLRPYQSDLSDAIDAAYGPDVRNVLAVLPTGGGKTKIFAHRVAAHTAAGGVAVVIAHRGEIVTQISTALAREGCRHQIIGPASLSRACTAAHMDDLGRSFVVPSARVSVASVDTLVRMDPATPWFQTVTLWVQDECHHVLAENKWGKACALFPNARGLGVTATPIRADGKGLGRHADGLFDTLCVGPDMRSLIREGFLADYDIACPPSDIDLSHVSVTAGGDFNSDQLRTARRGSHITGDVVANYLKFARGRTGVTFDTDIESATETAAAFRAAGVPAEVVSSHTPDILRRRIMRDLRARTLLMVVNVDLLGEGVDVPAIEVVCMARPTQSYGLYCQQFGRALRPAPGKTRALIIDHVGNVVRHGLPDAPRAWSLDRRERRGSSGPTDAVPLRSCLNTECLAVYERVLPACPHCGHEPPVLDRSAPEFVDGDLTLLSPEVLERLRAVTDHLNGPATVPYGATPEVVGAVHKRHWERQQAQGALRSAIALWAGWQKKQGREDPETYRRFWHRYGVDVLTAQGLKARDAVALTERIALDLKNNQVVAV